MTAPIGVRLPGSRFPFPLPYWFAGTTVRESLAQALRCEGRLLGGTLALATGEVDPATGFLAKATGEAEQHIGIDSGLFPQVVALQEVSGAASSHIQVRFHFSSDWRGAPYRVCAELVAGASLVLQRTAKQYRQTGIMAWVLTKGLTQGLILVWMCGSDSGF